MLNVTKGELLLSSTLVSAIMLVAVSTSFLRAQQPKPTARAIVEEIKKQVGVDWQQDPYI